MAVLQVRKPKAGKEPKVTAFPFASERSAPKGLLSGVEYQVSGFVLLSEIFWRLPGKELRFPNVPKRKGSRDGVTGAEKETCLSEGYTLNEPTGWGQTWDGKHLPGLHPDTRAAASPP